MQQKEVALQPGFGSIGGERRIVMWRQSAHNLPECPEAIVNEILRTSHCRIVLLTPAYFRQGYHPTWLCQKHQDSEVVPQLEAMVVQRPDVVSGWDIKARSPKSSRRLAPAGTVLYLSFKDDPTEEALRQWIRSIWFHSISDLQPDPTHPEQYRHDGFGIAAVGTWSGDPVPMEGQTE
jgi:CRISPR-associated protein Cmr3